MKIKYFKQNRDENVQKQFFRTHKTLKRMQTNTRENPNKTELKDLCNFAKYLRNQKKLLHKQLFLIHDIKIPVV